MPVSTSYPLVRAVLAVAAVAGAGIAAAVLAAPASAHHVQCGDVITRDTTLDSDLVNCPGNGLEIAASGVTLDLGGHVVDGDGQGLDSGIRSHGNEGVVIRNGTVREFAVGVSIGQAPQRGAFSTTHRVYGLTVIDNHTGISLAGGNDSVVERNVAAGNRVGIAVHESFRNLVEKNAASRNGTGIAVTGGSDNTVRQNRASYNERHGIELSATFTPQTGNVLERNVAEHNGMDGIFVFTRGSGNVLERNRTDSNGDDGIDANCGGGACSPGTITLTKNHADENGDLGIEADPGVDDGGKNKARRNGNSAQCTGISCK